MMTSVTVEGMLQADGLTLQLEKKLDLPPGKVTVTVQPNMPGAGTGATMVEVLDRIHREQQQRRNQPMTEEEMAAEIAQLRAEEDEYEQRCETIWSQTSTPPRKGE